MIADPLIAEVRAVREALFKECDNDLGKLVRYLHRERKRSGLKVVRLEPKRPAAAAPKLRDRTRNSA